MKKILNWILSIVCVLCACQAMTACVGVGYTSQSRYSNADLYLVGSQTYETAALTRLQIDWLSGDVVLVQDETATAVTVVETNTLEDAKKVHSYYHDGVLDIRFWQSGLRATVNDRDKRLTVTYPAAQSVEVKLSSGTMIADKIVADKVRLEMTSGDMNPKNVHCTDLDLKMTSGDFVCDKIECSVLNAQMTSGKSKIGELIATDATLVQTSGDTTLKQVSVDAFSSKSSSGDLDVTFARAGQVAVSLTSGDATIGLPSSGATVTVARKSGDFRTTLDYVVTEGKYVFGEGKCTMSIDLTSGNVRVK